MNNLNINEIKKRDLDKCAFALYFLPNTVFYNYGDDYIKERKIYSLFLCNIKGVRKYITSIFYDDYTKTSNWYDLFQMWKKKGLECLLYCVMPNDNNIKDAIALSFSECKCLISPFETIFKISKYFSCSYTANISETFRKLFIADSIDDFNFKKKDFIEYSSNFPYIKDLIESDLVTASKIMNMPFLLRKNVFSFYFMRDNIKRIATLSRTKSHFDSLLDLETLFVPFIISIEKYMYCPKKEWNEVLSIIYSDNKDLIIKYL